MHNASMLPAMPAGVDTRSDYERNLYAAIEHRRVMAREQLERDTGPRNGADVRALYNAEMSCTWGAELARRTDAAIMAELTGELETFEERALKYLRQAG